MGNRKVVVIYDSVVVSECLGAPGARHPEFLCRSILELDRNENLHILIYGESLKQQARGTSPFLASLRRGV